MPRYFFDFDDGVLSVDSEGTDLSGVPEARREAVRLMGALLAEYPASILCDRDCIITVRDGTMILLSVTSYLSDAPALGKRTS